MIRSNIDALQPEFTEFALPSGGVPYRAKYPDFPTTARVGSFTFKTEALLTTNLSELEKIAWITKEVFLNLPAGFQVDELLEEDQMVIMALARGQTYGESYRFATICPACQHRESHEIKIPLELPVRNWTFKTPEEMRAHLTVTLPKTKDVVTIRHMTVGVAKQRANDELLTKPDQTKPADSEGGEEKPRRAGKSVLVKSDAKKGPLDDLPKEAISYLSSFAWRIESVNGTTPESLQEAMEYLLRLPGADRVALQDHRDKSACGINYDIPVRCDKCKNQFTAFLPISTSFFRRGQ